MYCRKQESGNIVNMKTFFLVLMATLLGSSQSSDDFIVAGYLPEYRSYINVNNTAILLTDLILFSLEPNTLGAFGGCCLDDSHYKIAREARAHKKHFSNVPLRLWISVGGAGRSAAFNHIASDARTRSNFIKNLIDLCQKQLFDGIDLDWEQPSNEAECKDYERLLSEAALALHDANLLLSVTTRQTFTPKVWNQVDRIHFMGYDLLFGGGPKHHASFQIVTKVVEDWLDKYNYPSEVIVLGIPCYARHGDDPRNVKTFAELIDDGMDVGNVALTVDGSEWKGYLFDSIEAVKNKVDFAKKKGLGGVFLWELGHDKQDPEAAPGGYLLQAAAGVHEFSTRSDEL